MDAELVLGLCERFHCLPSELERESADLLRLVTIEKMGRRKEAAPEEEEVV